MSQRSCPWIEGIEWGRDGSFDRISSQPLKGKSAVVLGGGPSLTRSLVQEVAGAPLICANNAYLLSPEPTLVLAMDRRWWGWHGASVEAAGHVAVTALRVRESMPPSFPANGKIMRKVRSEEWFCPDPTELQCLNSGHAAINLTAHLGAKRIFLIGMDMSFRDGKTHWHGGHPIPASSANYEKRFRPALEKMVAILSNNGVEVATITPSAANIPVAPLQYVLDSLGEDHANRLDHPSP